MYKLFTLLFVYYYLYCGLSLVSLVVIKTMAKGDLGRKGLFGLYILFKGHNPFLREFIAGTKEGQELMERSWETILIG